MKFGNSIERLERLRPDDILLVGAGHAHLSALSWLATHASSELANGWASRLVWVSDEPRTAYSGVLPEVLARVRPETDLWIKVREFAASLGVDFVQARLESVDQEWNHFTFRAPSDMRILVSAPRVYSLNLGAGGELRPWSRIVSAVAGLDACPETEPVHVVGGGAAGCEMAAALVTRWRGRRPVHLYEKSPQLQPQVQSRFGRRWQRHLQDLGVNVRLGFDASSIQDGAVIRLTGAKPAPLTGVYIKVDGRLQILDEPLRSGSLGFASGDMVTQEGEATDLPRSGARAVRQGVHLAQQLLPLLGRTAGQAGSAACGPVMRPLRRHLSLQFEGGSRAFACFGSTDLGCSQIWLSLKRRIDDAYLARFRNGADSARPRSRLEQD